MSKHLFIFGHGFTCEAVSTRLKTSIALISGTTRSPLKAEKLSANGVRPLLFDGIGIDDELRSQLASASHILVSIGPDEAGDAVLNAVRNDIARSRSLEWIGYLSTVGVYGDHNGAWVDEDTDCRPVSKRSLQRMEAEKEWEHLANQLGIPLAIFRLSGIYGPGRNTFMNIENGTARRLVKPDQVFNRIHREDIAQAVDLAMKLNASGIFNITDDFPAPPQDVVSFAYHLMGRVPPAEIDFETAELSAMARSFYGENKRVSNKNSKQVLGMQYLWPDYKTSLERMWKENSWRR